MKKLLTLAVLSALGLAGCGSDSDNVTPPTKPEQPESTPRYANLDIQPEINMVFDGSIRVYLGPFKPCGFEDGVTKGQEKGAGHDYCVPNPTAAGEYQSALTVDDSKYTIEISARELNEVLGESLRPDLYQPGQYSLFDVLYYLAQTRDDLQLLTTDNEVISSRDQLEFDESIGTYRFHVSWDRNGDGQFNEEDNVAAAAGTDYEGMGAEENYQSPNWYGRFTYYAGDFLREAGSSTLETLYDRLDEFLIKNNTYLRFESFDPAMTERREWVQQRQVARKNSNGGPIMLIDFNEGKGLEELTPEITAKAHDIRSDIYQAGTMTAMDALMTAHEQGLAEVRFSFWPTVSTNANVGNYAVHKINHLRTEGMAGWAALSIGERATLNDFFRPAFPYLNPAFADSKVESYGPTLDKIIALSNANHPKTPCQWLRPMNATGDYLAHTRKTAALCLDEWGNMFGGTKLHQMTDTWLITYPPEVISLKHIGDLQIRYWNPTEKNNINWDYDNHNDTKYEIYDLNEEVVAPMDDSHFGWGIADCGLCHSLDTIHTRLKGGDSPALPEKVQPHFCASCHGNNGAPAGHGETTRCFWCHSKDKAMANHGDASLKRTINDVQCQERTDYVSEDNLAEGSWDGMGPCANGDNLTPKEDNPLKGTVVVMKPHDQAGNNIDYPAGQSTQGNSDWHTSDTMPDPYSCLTCHPNQAE